MKLIVERRKSHEGIIGKETREEFNLSYEKEAAIQAIYDVLNEIDTYHANNDTEIHPIESEYIEDVKRLKEGFYSFNVGDFVYYVEIISEV